jgi:23S rRNA (pseudouridine1915-N3)-methyltransferase
MKLSIIHVGRPGPVWLRDAVAEYVKRLPPELRLDMLRIAPARRSANEPRTAVAAAEAARIRSAVPRGARTIALDERGRQIDTATLAARLRDWMEEGRDTALVIGGPDGLEQSFADAADERWALSRLTLPHGLVRLVLVEQLYRAWTILAGHPYHRS